MTDVRQRNEVGALGGVEGLAFGVLIFVFGTLMVGNAWNVVDAKLATSAAAREAARVYVESDSAADAESAARLRARDVVDGHGRTLTSLAVAGSGFGRCTEVAISVTSGVPRVALPLIGGGGGVTSVTSTHTEIIDPYRSGLDGSAAC